MNSHSSAAASDSTYNYHVVKQFTIMTIVWGIVGMGVGVLLAAQLVWPALNDIFQPYTHFGRWLARPVYLLGLAAGDSIGGHYLANGSYDV